jgi:hypothetical protein
VSLTSSLQNKIPILDKGYATVVAVSLDSQDFEEVKKQFFNNQLDTRLTDLCQVHLLIKCPLFVQLSFQDVGFKCVAQRQSNIESYIPKVNEIGAKTLRDSEDIHKHMDETSAALLMNIKHYQMEGCDMFAAQINSPISIYSTLMVSCTLTQLIAYCNKKNLPAPIEAYRSTIQQIIEANWNSVWELLDDKKEENKKDRQKS